MRFKPLGTSGLRVSELCLGTVSAWLGSLTGQPGP
jgi:aryl-alcohol dehydrogenase-like predicted oxidoreductase